MIHSVRVSQFLSFTSSFSWPRPEGGKERKGNPIAFLGLIDGDPRMIEDKTAIFFPFLAMRFPELEKESLAEEGIWRHGPYLVTGE